MNKITKIWLIIAAALVALGLVIFAGVMTAYDYDFTKLSTVTYEAKTHEIGDAFDKIAICQLIFCEALSLIVGN